MCEVANEEETYEELNNNLPSAGEAVTTPEGLKGEVQSLSVLRQLVRVIVTLDNDEKEIREYPAADLKFKPRRRKKDVKLSKQEMKELAASESWNHVCGRDRIGSRLRLSGGLYIGVQIDCSPRI